MKFPTCFSGALGFLCFHAVSASAATLVSNNFIISTTVGTTTDIIAPTSQAVSNGTIASLGSAALVSTPGGVPNLRFDLAAAASVAVSRPSGGGVPVDLVSAYVEYKFVFNLAALETRLATFDLNYSLSENGINGSVTWALVGPGSVAVAAISGTKGNPANSTEAIPSTALPTQTATLSTAGSYTLTLRAEMLPQTVQANKNMTINMNTASLGLTAIPESSCLGFLSLALLALVRRR
jgi:hypothetical protein